MQKKKRKSLQIKTLSKNLKKKEALWDIQRSERKAEGLAEIWFNTLILQVIHTLLN